MKIYIVNNVSDHTKENRHWAFDTQEKANEFANDLINGLKEREEIEYIVDEWANKLICGTTYGQYVRIYTEELELS